MGCTPGVHTPEAMASASLCLSLSLSLSISVCLPYLMATVCSHRRWLPGAYLLTSTTITWESEYMRKRIAFA
jgi:hypothetical protein